MYSCGASRTGTAAEPWWWAVSREAARCSRWWSAAAASTRSRHTRTSSRALCQARTAGDSARSRVRTVVNAEAGPGPPSPRAARSAGVRESHASRARARAS